MSLSIVKSPGGDSWTNVLVDQMKSRADAVALEGRDCIERGGQLAWWMREKIAEFRAATAIGDARVQAAEMLCSAMWIDAHFKGWEKERADVVVTADNILGALLGVEIVDKRIPERETRAAKERFKERFKRVPKPKALPSKKKRKR